LKAFKKNTLQIIKTEYPAVRKRKVLNTVYRVLAQDITLTGSDGGTVAEIEKNVTNPYALPTAPLGQASHMLQSNQFARHYF
jgi:hypothetical protein